MKKSLSNDNVFYTIAWSKLYHYDKHEAGRVLPELAGIICLVEELPRGDPAFLIFYGCWREGLRMGLKNFMDPDFTKYPELLKDLLGKKVRYKYTVVDSNPTDMQDILFWLIQNYTPLLNNPVDFKDSGRYENIFVKETQLRDDEVVERLPRTGL